MTQPIIINQYDLAIADSPHKGFGLMRCVDIDAFPGALKVNKAPTFVFPTTLSSTFTADASDVLTWPTASVPNTGTAVTVFSDGTLPAGLTAGTQYFIIKIDSSTCKLATTIALANAGTAVNITDAGTGVHHISNTTAGTILHIVKDQRTGTRFFIDSNGRVWYLDSGTVAKLLAGNTRTNSSGNGLAILQTSDGNAMYLFVFRNALIDVINVYGTANLETPSWTSGWQTMNAGAGAGNRHHAIYAQDAIIYYTDARYIGSIREKIGQVFDPASSATYTWTSQALDTPQGEILAHLEELGTNLLAAGGTWNKIYPWDRISDSYNLPINVPENQVLRIKNIGNLVYILAGTWGNIYTTQGSYVTLFKKIPEYVTNNSGTLTSSPITWGGIDAVNGNLLFGMSVQTTGNSGTYMLYPDGRLVIDNLPSTGSTNSTAFEVTNNFYYVGFSGGADTMSTSRYSNYEGVLHSPLYKVSTKTEKGQFSTLEVQIAKPATTGHVRIKYRVDTSTAFADFPGGAVLVTADSASTSWEFDIGLIDLENLQVQVEIDGNMELMEVRLIP